MAWPGEIFWLRIQNENIKGEQMLYVRVIFLLKREASALFMSLFIEIS